MPGKKRQ